MTDRDLKISCINENLKYIPKFDILSEFLGQIQEYGTYIAGGAIRDLIKKSPNNLNDLDIFVDQSNWKLGSFDMILKFLSIHGRLEFGQYGSPRWYPIQNSKFYYDIVPFSKFDVGFGNPSSVKDLLSQFDFTANAIAYDFFNSKFHDPVNGLLDLEHKVFRYVRLDFPDQVISKQIPIERLTVLWFRFMHYASKLNFKIDEKTLDWMSNNYYRIKSIDSFEKYFFKPFISEELIKML